MMAQTSHSESELRGMITARQREVEEIMIRCAASPIGSHAAEVLASACHSMLLARASLTHAAMEAEKVAATQGGGQ